MVMISIGLTVGTIYFQVDEFIPNVAVLGSRKDALLLGTVPAQDVLYGLLGEQFEQFCSSCSLSKQREHSRLTLSCSLIFTLEHFTNYVLFKLFKT